MATQSSFRRSWKAFRRKWGARIVPLAGAPLFGLLARTWRVEVVGREHFEAGGRGAITALWHGRMLLGIRTFARRNVHVLVSMSGDGDVSEKLLESFGFHVVRGSSSRGGARSLRELREILGAGGTIAITPDGPRGPRHGMNAGLAWLAKATGHPIVPCGLVASRAWRLRSWDRFTIPKPFARVAIVFEPPIFVPREADEADQAALTERVRERILEAETDGCRRIGAELDW